MQPGGSAQSRSALSPARCAALEFAPPTLHVPCRCASFLPLRGHRFELFDRRRAAWGWPPCGVRRRVLQLVGWLSAQPLLQWQRCHRACAVAWRARIVWPRSTRELVGVLHCGVFMKLKSETVATVNVTQLAVHGGRPPRQAGCDGSEHCRSVRSACAVVLEALGGTHYGRARHLCRACLHLSLSTCDSRPQLSRYRQSSTTTMSTTGGSSAAIPATAGVLSGVKGAPGSLNPTATNFVPPPLGVRLDGGGYGAQDGGRKSKADPWADPTPTPAPAPGGRMRQQTSVQDTESTTFEAMRNTFSAIQHVPAPPAWVESLSFEIGSMKLTMTIHRPSHLHSGQTDARCAMESSESSCVHSGDIALT